MTKLEIIRQLHQGEHEKQNELSEIKTQLIQLKETQSLVLQALETIRTHSIEEQAQRYDPAWDMQGAALLIQNTLESLPQELRKLSMEKQQHETETTKKLVQTVEQLQQAANLAQRSADQLRNVSTDILAKVQAYKPPGLLFMALMALISALLSGGIVLSWAQIRANKPPTVVLNSATVAQEIMKNLPRR